MSYFNSVYAVLSFRFPRGIHERDINIVSLFPTVTPCRPALVNFTPCAAPYIQPARVSAHNVEMGKGQRDKTVFLIKFDPEVLLREARLG